MFQLLKQCKFLLIVFLLPLYILAQQSSADLYDQAIEAMNAGNYRSAELLFHTLIDNNDEFSERASFQLAKAIHFQGRYRAAIFEFNRYLLIATNDQTRSETRFWIAESYYHSDNKLQSIEEYKRYMSQQLTDNELVVTSYRRIGYIYFTQSRYDEAVIEWNHAINRAPDIQVKNSIKYDIAVSYFQNRQYQEALRRTDLLLDEVRSNILEAQCFMLKGKIYQKQNRHTAAVREFSRIDKKLYSRKPVYEALYYVSLSYMELGNKDEAMKNLTLFIRYGRGSRLLYNAQLELARIFYEENQYDKALRLYDNIIQNSQERSLAVRAVTMAATIHVKRRNYSAARSTAQNILKYSITYDTREAYILLVDIYIAEGLYEESEIILKEMQEKLQFDPKIDSIQYKLSYVYLQQERYDEAIDGFKQIDRLNPFSEYKSESFYFIAAANYSAKKYAEAERYIQRYLQSGSTENRYDAYIVLLQIYIETNKRVQANRIAERIIQNYPQEESNARLLFRCAQIAGQSQSVYERYVAYIKNTFPESQTALSITYMDGVDYLEKKQYALSAKSFLVIIDAGQYNNYKNSVYNYVYSLYMQKKLNKVLEYTASLPPELDRVEANAVRLLGARTLVDTKRFSHAEVQYTQIPDEYYEAVDHHNIIMIAIEKNADYTYFTQIDREKTGSYYNNTVEAVISHLEKKGEFEHARFVCTSLIEKNGESPFLFSLIARMYMHEGNYEASADAASKAETMSREIFALQVQRYIETGKNKEFVSYLAGVINEARVPVPREALYQGGSFALEHKNYSDFTVILNYYQKQFPGDSYLISILNARYYMQLSDYSRAYSFYNAAFRINNKSAEALYGCGRYHQLVSKNKNRASDFYRLALALDYDDEGFVARCRIAYSLVLLDDERNSEARVHLESVDKNSAHPLYSRQARRILNHYYGD